MLPSSSKTIPVEKKFSCFDITRVDIQKRNPIWEKYAKSRVHPSKFRLPASARLAICSSSQRGQLEYGPVSAASKQFSGSGLAPPLRLGFGRHRMSLEPMRAYRDDFFKIKLPEIKEKPEWWWRTLACIPYLIALQISDVGYYVQPLLENHEVIGDAIFFIPGAIRRWPSWFFMAYCYIGYMWVVKKREVPHFLRFHVMMGMLLETGLQIIWCGSNFFPLIHFGGRLGKYYWAGIGFGYICLVMECIRCALAGIYAQIPFVSDAAFVHTLFNLGGFQRPLR